MRRTLLRSTRVALCAIAWLHLPSHLQAQAGAPPDGAARDALEQQRAAARERALRQRLEPAPGPGAPALQPALPSPAEVWPTEETPCVPIREIVLVGPDAGAFAWAIASLLAAPHAAIGRCLGARGLQVAAGHAQRALLARGYVTSRVLLQPQMLDAGRLMLHLVPGRIRTIAFAPGTSARATQRNALPVRPGDILDLRAIEQGLENLKRVPTVTADVRIAPAGRPDESDLIVAWRQGFPVRLTAAADDGGTRATGRYQGSLTLSYDHPFELNDLFYLTLSHDLGGGEGHGSGTQGRTVHYSLPWGAWLLGMTTTQSDYHQRVAGLAQDYVYSGNSDTAELRLTRVLHRDARWRLSAHLKGWARRSSNFIDDTEVEPQRRSTGGWEIGAGVRAWLASATLEVNLAHRRGTGAFGARPAPEERFGEGDSRMRIGTADASLSWPWAWGGQRLRYAGAWRAQWNGGPLTPPDRLALGGRYTVRGFDGQSTLMAERGWLVRNDLGLAMGGGAELYAGLDRGQVQGPSARTLRGRALTGAVLGLRGADGPLSYDVFVGRPVSHPTGFRAARTTTGFSLVATF